MVLKYNSKFTAVQSSACDDRWCYMKDVVANWRLARKSQYLCRKMFLSQLALLMVGPKPEDVEFRRMLASDHQTLHKGG